jgi:hypothetical protein
MRKGDVYTDRHYIVLAVASGALAAISIYEDILNEGVRNLNRTYMSCSSL